MKSYRDTIVRISFAAALCLPFAPAHAQPTPAQPPPPSTGPGRGLAAAPAASADTVVSAARAAASANLASSKVTSPPVGKTAGQSRRAGGDPVDDRVELRSYQFTNTDETLPYAVFVSSKVSKDQKAPLVLALHGMGGNHGTFMRTACVEEAEKNGYILIGAMGYSPNGPFGMQFGMGGRGRGGPGGPGGRGGAPGAGTGAAPGGVPGAAVAPGDARGGAFGATPGGRGGRGPAIGGTKETDSAKVAQLSEIDAITVLEMALKEFNVDDHRIYLMGHSLGGGGALHMGEKYASLWAGVAALAPAAFGFQWTADSKLKNVPLLIVQGEADTMVRPAGSQQLSEQLKGLKFQCEYKSMPGLDHGGIIAGGMPETFKFFNQHTKPETK
jgi:predicted esterase